MRNKSSRFLGVTFDAHRQNWKAQIFLRVPRSLGRFADEEEAARAHDNARLFLRRYFPKPLQDADLNFPDETEACQNISDAALALEKQLDLESAPKYHHYPRERPAGDSEATWAHLTMELERLNR